MEEETRGKQLIGSICTSGKQTNDLTLICVNGQLNISRVGIIMSHLCLFFPSKINDVIMWPYRNHIHNQADLIEKLLCAT